MTEIGVITQNQDYVEGAMPNTAKFDSAIKVSTLKKQNSSKDTLSPIAMPQMKNLRG